MAFGAGRLIAPGVLLAMTRTLTVESVDANQIHLVDIDTGEKFDLGHGGMWRDCWLVQPPRTT